MLSLIISGCTEGSLSGTSSASSAEYTVRTDGNGDTVVIDSKGNVFASTGNGDIIDVDGDGNVTVKSENGKETTIASDKAEIESIGPEVDKADTSGMDFTFDDSDTSVSSNASGTQADLSQSTQNSSLSGISCYNVTSGGTYTLTGTKTDLMILIDAGNADVTLILNGLTVKNSKGPAIYVRSADKVTLTLSDGSVNTLSDGSSYSITDSDSALDAAVFSKSDLTVNGSGTLNVNGNYKHGIVSKDDLVISSGTVKVTAQSAGMVGKDCVKINSGKITVNAGTDGIRSDNAEDTAKGYIYLSGGTVNVVAGNDGIQAETVLKIEKVDLTVKTGGGSSGSLTSSSESYKGLKAGSDIYVTGGTFNIDSKDDCIHSNGTVTVAGGTYTLSSGDDGIHADTDLAVSGSLTKLTINKSYEGIEATNLVISGGNISVTATDDGLNAAGGNNSTSIGSGGRPGQGSFTSSNGSIKITGGTIHISMSGDGIDANGTLSVTGGNITVSGPNSGDTAILDFDSTGTISGGTFIGTGASGMSQNFSSSSTQGAVMIKTGSQSAGTTVTLTDSSGNVLLTRKTDKAYSCIIFSCSAISKGGSYKLTAGTYSLSFTMSSLVYSAGSSGSGRR